MTPENVEHLEKTILELIDINAEEVRTGKTCSEGAMAVAQLVRVYIDLPRPLRSSARKPYTTGESAEE